MPSRTPPREIQETLKREVNFGCPVQGCGIPYLSWHHFDPPWRERHHHDPHGMIALCLTHAGHADGERWTPQQLREMKNNPFLTRKEISDRFDYLRKNVVCVGLKFNAHTHNNLIQTNSLNLVNLNQT